jgi:hypothetical protein
MSTNQNTQSDPLAPLIATWRKAAIANGCTHDLGVTESVLRGLPVAEARAKLELAITRLGGAL